MGKPLYTVAAITITLFATSGCMSLPFHLPVLGTASPQYAPSLGQPLAHTVPVSYNSASYASASVITSGGFNQWVGEPTDAPLRRALLAQAYQSLGTPYFYGGANPQQGFDCSGLTQFVYQTNGLKLPRTAAQQHLASRTISFEQMRPGDLIFFRTSGSIVNHVGIYIGRGEFIHAASGSAKVAIDSLSKTYWQQRLVKFGSFLA